MAVLSWASNYLRQKLNPFGRWHILSKESSIGSPNQDFNQVLQIITALAERSASGDYIYRGESQCFDKVSSRLYREYPSSSDIEAVQDAELEEAKRYTFETDDFTILTELQHYGGRTNLIDFTADYLIALFFACDGDYPHDGRVILLEKTAEREEEIYGPRYPANRVLAQKSIFVRPKAGYVEPDATVVIPCGLKLPMLEYLEKGHGIYTATVYNDLHGFIRLQTIHREANENFATALDCQLNGDHQGAIEWYDKALNLNPRMARAYYLRGNSYSDAGEFDQAIADYSKAIELAPEFPSGYIQRGVAHVSQGNDDLAIEDYTKAIELAPEFPGGYFQRGFIFSKQGNYLDAIHDFTRVIELDPDSTAAYCNRGEIQMYLAQWEAARSDLMIAHAGGFDIVASFHNDHQNVTCFEERTSLIVPKDIAEMLGG